MTKRKRDPKPRKPRTTPIDLAADDAALIFTSAGGVQLLMPDSDANGEVPGYAGLAGMLWARLSRDPAWVTKLARELEAWALGNGLKRTKQEAVASAKSRGAVMEGVSHAVH